MRIILSPAKKMRTDTDSVPFRDLPVFLEDANEILAVLQRKSYEELKRLWGCKDTIARQNQERLQGMQLCEHLTPAILSYDGIAYQYMAPAVFADSHFDYVQEHLRILSGFYGVLKPLDGVQPYRLEMQAKLPVNDKRDLYAFWGEKLYKEVRDDGIIINLASKEYARCIEKYITPMDHYITCSFCQMQEGNLVQKGTFAKMARGEMVRFMAENAITDPKDMQKFNRLGYQYSTDCSDDHNYIFLRTK